MTKFLDTCYVLDYYNELSNPNVIVSSKTIEELENIKINSLRDESIKYRARQAVKMIEKYSVKVWIVQDEEYDLVQGKHLETSNDNLIIASAVNYAKSYPNENVVFYTNDYLCRIVARDIFQIQVGKFGTKEDILYTGCKKVEIDDENLARFYGNLKENIFDCLINEYVILHQNGEAIDKLRWTSDGYKNSNYRQISNDFLGKVKPRNVMQELAFDMLQNNDITIKCIDGKFGTGKDFIMIANAINLIRNNKYDKLIWIRNNIEVKNSKPIGFLPGTGDEKLLPYAMPMADHLGGKNGLEMFMSQGKIEIQHLGFVRGRDIKNSIIYCSEAENMTKEHVQLLIGRVGDNSALWINGDFKQVDDKIFESNNGMRRLIDKLKGNEHFGYVHLEKTERSETAALADLLD